MGKKMIPLFPIFIILIAGCSYPVNNTVRCVQLDPLEKVFTEESYFVESLDTMAVAKGETATFQFVLKSSFLIQDLKIEAGNLINNNEQIAPTLKAFVEYIRAETHTIKHSRNALFPVSDYYPDCLQEMDCIDVPPMQNQPVWVSYTIPRDAKTGNYSATLVFSGIVNGKPLKITKKVNTKVYPVVLPEQTLLITNWWSPRNFSKMNGNQPVKLYSDRYWELLAAMANVMRDHGQNSYKIGGFHQDEFWTSLCDIQCSGTQYSFNFTNFDKMIELLINEGGLKRIEGGHIAGRMPNTGVWYNQKFGIYVPNRGLMSFDEDISRNFLSQFLTSLYSHLRVKGWDSIYVQYVADEPTDENVMVMKYTDKPTNQNALSFVPIAEFVKEHMPGIPIIEAVMTTKINNSVNIWVPKLDHYRKEKAFFLERQAEGDEVWFYTCNEPQGDFANRYLELPLIQTRLMHWINYRFGLTGYLHWGFNYWNLSSNTLPAGDASIVYPAYGKVNSSIRLAAMRDGIADYELLKLLEQKSPDKAQDLARAIIKDVDNYENEIYKFRHVRKKLLEHLLTYANEDSN